jgi:hypothetical protein
MGFDINGLNPKNECGKYFQRSFWGWRPIANYILEMVPEEITNQCKYWMSNDGAGLDEENSLRLLSCLHRQIDDGTMKAYKKGYDQAQALARMWADIYRQKYPNSYFFSIEDIKEFCDFLENCGGFTID